MKETEKMEEMNEKPSLVYRLVKDLLDVEISRVYLRVVDLIQNGNDFDLIPIAKNVTMEYKEATVQDQGQ